MMPLMIVWKRIPDDMSKVKPPFGMVDDVREEGRPMHDRPSERFKRTKI
jgi:hypothetical protein